MAIPKNLQFTDNQNVNIIAEERAELMFGKDWRNRSDLLLYRESGLVRISDNKGSVRSLLVEQKNYYPNYEISCHRNDAHDNPVPNVPALLRFYPSGNPAYQSHFHTGCGINPPDGTPSSVNYKESGGLSDCYYVDANGTHPVTAKPATKKEIAKRIKAAKRTTAESLCAGPQEIVALKSGMSHQGSPRKLASGLQHS